jgi:hypothetical protein
MFVRVVVSAIANQIPWDQIKEGQNPPKIYILNKKLVALNVYRYGTHLLFFAYVFKLGSFFTLDLNKSYFS